MPVFTTRVIEDFPIGNVLLRDHHSALKVEGLHTHPHAWLSAVDVSFLSMDGPQVLVDEKQTPLAWFGEVPDLSNAVVASGSFLIVYPWDLIRANEQHVASLTEPRIEGSVHPNAVIEGVVHLGPGSRILPGVFIEGNVVIGANTKIGPNCYLRGSTSIGDKCHVGNAVEIKNSILLSGTNVGHLSYVGDSVLGEKVNFGAGTITSNLRHDGKNHRTQVDGVLVDTGRRKFGCIVGDGVHTGINTSIYPGRKLWPGTSTRPGEIVQRDLTVGSETH
jgi:bifunctional UDP-N-acetylglucosamine pyrophosphorylase/glucosamine-1-phosphate N-acetyltransferase